MDINKENLSLLERQVETDQNRLENGLITLADLAQSESSLAGAQAQFINSKNDLVTAKLTYENIFLNWDDKDNNLFVEEDLYHASIEQIEKISFQSAWI